MKTLISKFLIIFGIVCYTATGYLFYQRTNPNRVSFAYEQVKKPAAERKQESMPVRLTIRSVMIDLPVLPAEINNGQWEATTKGVSYLASSPIPGESGNSVLYGHNWTNLLGRLVAVKPGNTFEIEYADKTKKEFTVEYTVTVSPDQTHILAPSMDKRVTIYTCTGFLDSKRFVVVGILK